MSKEFWSLQHIKYKETDWIGKPSIFSQRAIKYFPKDGKLLDIGCGQGQDSRYFAENGYNVTALDFSEVGIKIAKEKSNYPNLEYKISDISATLPFDDSSFDIIYSHLAIHYFSKDKTESIFKEIKRVLKSEGILAILVNSINDPEYETGEKIEDDYFQIGNVTKRYFSKETLGSFTNGFQVLLLDEEGETYKDRAISTENLVQYVGRKV
jgi:ubiquinone/menaquinone biosynthesis C-methylase UbiE